MNLFAARASRPLRPAAASLARLSRRLGAVIAECNDASRLLTVKMMSTDAYLIHPDQAPDSYDEFLHRTSGPQLHEPSAAQRARAERAPR